MNHIMIPRATQIWVSRDLKSVYTAEAQRNKRAAILHEHYVHILATYQLCDFDDTVTV